MSIETQKSDFKDTPEDNARRWQMELKASRQALEAEKFFEVAKRADEALRDQTPSDNTNKKRLCLYPSSIQTVGAVLFGRMPEASVSRKFGDGNDDVARVASTILERTLNCHIERADDSFAEATRNAMMDWRSTSGLGVQRHRYEVEWETVPEQPAVMDEQTGAEMAPAVPATERKAREWVETDYVFYGDFLWGMGNHIWPPTWMASASLVPKEKLVKKFGEEAAADIPLNAKHSGPDRREEDKSHPWDRAKLWEIWDSESKCMFFVVEGHPRVLIPQGFEVGEGPGELTEGGGLRDPLGLPGFFPFQRPLMANLTTSKLIPVSDYKFSQDLYDSINVLMTRIGILEGVVRAAALYNKAAGSIVEKLLEGGDNKAYPADQWAMFAESGGIKGNMDWLPLEQIVATLNVLREQLREKIDLVFQVTGQSDLMRGQQTMNGTPGEAQVKAKFGSIRLQSWQDELARFASDGQRIRAAIISKHFDPETIKRDANVASFPKPDLQFVDAAIELIKSDLAPYRIEIKPEAINLTDFAAMSTERSMAMADLARFFQAVAPMTQMFPDALPHLLEMGQWFISGLKGASTMEGIFDQMVEAAKQAIAQAKQQQAMAAANGPPPDPKLQVAQMKLQGDQQKAQAELVKIQAETQARGAELQMETQAKAQQEEIQAHWNVREAIQKQAATNALKPPEMPKPGGIS